MGSTSRPNPILSALTRSYPLPLSTCCLHREGIPTLVPPPSRGHPRCQHHWLDGLPARHRRWPDGLSASASPVLGPQIRRRAEGSTPPAPPLSLGRPRRQMRRRAEGSMPPAPPSSLPRRQIRPHHLRPIRAPRGVRATRKRATFLQEWQVVAPTTMTWWR